MGVAKNLLLKGYLVSQVGEKRTPPTEQIFAGKNLLCWWGSLFVR